MESASDRDTRQKDTRWWRREEARWRGSAVTDNIVVPRLPQGQARRKEEEERERDIKKGKCRNLQGTQRQGWGEQRWRGKIGVCTAVK